MAEHTPEPKGLAACEDVLRPLLQARNAAGLRRLAEQQEVPRDEFEAFLRTLLEEELEEGNPVRVGPRFDIHTGGYITLEEWMSGFLKSL